MISRDEQRRQGLLPPKTNIVRAYSTDSHPLPSVAPSDPLGWLANAIHPAAHQPNRGAQSQDTAISSAFGWMLSAAPFVAVIATITAAALLLVWLFAGGRWQNYMLSWLLLWGLGALIVMLLAHRAHLAHSPAGVELSDISRQRADSDNRTSVALAAIDEHQRLLHKQLDFAQSRWLLEHGHIDEHRRLTGGDQ